MIASAHFVPRAIAVLCVLGCGTAAQAQCQTWRPFLAGPTNLVYAMASHDDGSGSKLYIGGEFTGFAGIPPQLFSDHIARWDGVTWRPVGPSPGFQDTVLALAEYDSGSGPELYAGGYFTSVNGIEARHIARWDGSAWHPLAGGGIDQVAFTFIFVESMAVHDDGAGRALYVAGRFRKVGGGLPASHIAKWDGIAWSALGSGLASTDTTAVRAMVSHDDGSGPALYVAGSFAGAGGIPANNMARWCNGAWEPVGEGVISCDDLLSYDDGSGSALYVAGRPPSIGTAGVARWDGTQFAPIGQPSSSGVNALLSFDDGRGAALYATGTFSSIGGELVRRISRWNGQSWEPLGNGLSSTGFCMAAHDDGTGPALYVGGQFTTVAATSTYRIASWRACATPIDTLCFGDGTLVACPCTPNGTSGHGCQNSADPLGARLSVSGTPSADDLVLNASHMNPNATCLFFQGDLQVLSAFANGDGLLCAGGMARRLYLKSASAGAATAPEGGDSSIRARAATLGDPLSPGSVRIYQTYYRDPALVFCDAPAGNAWNLTNAARVVW